MNQSLGKMHRVDLSVLLVITTIVAAYRVTGQCVDLVQDCGGKADNHTDNAQAFAVCQHLASQRSGCITVPAGLFRLSSAMLNRSNIDIRVSNDAVFLPLGQTQALFMIGIYLPSSTEYVRNISLHGQAPGRFTIDVSIALVKPWHTRGVSFDGPLKDFLVANMHCKMANPIINRLTPSRSENPCMGMHNKSFNGVRLNPQQGTLHNLSCAGCTWGYGLIQIHSGEKISFENMYSEGGVTLRLETGGLAFGYVGEITARNITCKNGQGALLTSPHIQKNGEFHVQDVLAISCNYAYDIAGGYSQSGYPPGYYSNSSTVTNLVGVYDTHAQNSANDTFVPSCVPCANQNSLLNYNVTLSGIKAVGFPPPSDRTQCIHYARSAGCPYYK